MYVAGGLACVWYYRKTLLQSVGRFIYAGLLPTLGVLILLGALIKAIPTTPIGTLIPAAVFVLIGLPIAYIIKRTSHTNFFEVKAEAAND
jgi:ACR3 family arsenite efflux pump ArsB